MMDNPKREEEKIFKNYNHKIISKFIDSRELSRIEEEANDINNFVVLFNWCFIKRNNFFVQNFNPKVLKNINEAYNKVKGNILMLTHIASVDELFGSLDTNNIKSIKFIVFNFIKNYDSIKNNPDNSELCNVISRESMRNCMNYIERYISRTSEAN